MSKIKQASIYLMGGSYIVVGILHFINPNFFLKIMPPYLPYHLELVYLSGFFEIVLGGALLVERTRYYAAWGLILLLLAVFPANIYLAQSEEAQKALEISQITAVLRLPFQGIFIALAHWHRK